MQPKFGAGIMALTILPSTTAIAAYPPGVTAFVRNHKLVRYTTALSDLDGDGHPEALIYALAIADDSQTPEPFKEANLCGSGGCLLYVLSLTPTNYRVITKIPIVKLPVRVMSSISHGWHDLGVQVSGGGIIPGYEARLRFDGHSYPSNPSVPPATSLKKGLRQYPD
ncbi:hypothetical protein [Gluconobacter thailandicus]|uniref:VCBS repeat-containing protein n=1 Tax=Gluconobacter thailandicus TaxID=257438 RepID=A0AAP9EUU1_GLUTH|nr:hypothetical protein [Gluconobacter thailandicus]QEH96807.1 hypothetical protein FXF46_11215 [Gluconobacter thailandicus]